MPIIANNVSTDPATIALTGSFRTQLDVRTLDEILARTRPGEPLVLDLTDLDVVGRRRWRRLRRVINQARSRRPIAADARTLERRMTIERRGLRGAYPVTSTDAGRLP